MITGAQKTLPPPEGIPKLTPADLDNGEGANDEQSVYPVLRTWYPGMRKYVVQVFPKPPFSLCVPYTYALGETRLGKFVPADVVIFPPGVSSHHSVCYLTVCYLTTPCAILPPRVMLYTVYQACTTECCVFVGLWGGVRSIAQEGVGLGHHPLRTQTPGRNNRRCDFLACAQQQQHGYIDHAPYTSIRRTACTGIWKQRYRCARQAPSPERRTS